MDFPIVIIWINPLSRLGASGVFFMFISFIDESFAVLHLGLFCLPMAHKKNARLISL